MSPVTKARIRPADPLHGSVARRPGMPQPCNVVLKTGDRRVGSGPANPAVASAEPARPGGVGRTPPSAGSPVGRRGQAGMLGQITADARRAERCTPQTAAGPVPRTFRRGRVQPRAQGETKVSADRHVRGLPLSSFSRQPQIRYAPHGKQHVRRRLEQVHDKQGSIQTKPFADSIARAPNYQTKTNSRGTGPV